MIVLLNTSSRAKRGIPDFISQKHTITNQTLVPFLIPQSPNTWNFWTNFL